MSDAKAVWEYARDDHHRTEPAPRATAPLLPVRTVALAGDATKPHTLPPVPPPAVSAVVEHRSPSRVNGAAWKPAEAPLVDVGPLSSHRLTTADRHSAEITDRTRASERGSDAGCGREVRRKKSVRSNRSSFSSSIPPLFPSSLSFLRPFPVVSAFRLLDGRTIRFLPSARSARCLQLSGVARDTHTQTNDRTKHTSAS